MNPARRILGTLLAATLATTVGCGQDPPDGGGVGGGALPELGLQVVDLTAGLRRTAIEARFASLEDHRRAAVLLTPPEARTTELTVPAVDPVLRFAFGLVEGPEESCLVPARFRVVIHEGGEAPHVAFQEEVSGSRDGWHAASVPLSTWAGRNVTLAFEATAGELSAGAEACLTSPAAFGDLRVVAGEANGDGRPDLWVVVVDALRADHVGYLSADAPDTPVMDALAATSYRFTDALTPSPWTREAVYALLTGSYATAAVRGTRDVYGTDLAEHVPTIPERLGAEGYRTIGIYANAVLTPENGSERGFDVYAYVRGDGDLPDYLDELRAESDPRRPQLVYAHLISPHVPYCQHEGITERYLREAGVAEPWPGCVGELEDNRGRPVASRDKETVSAYYRGEVQFADWVVGRLVDQADSREGGRPAWLMVTSDHGEELWDHGGFEHGHTLYQELLHVPLLVRPPAGHAARSGGVEIDQPVSLVDLGNTLAELAGVPSLAPTAGISLPLQVPGKAIDLPGDRTRLAYGLIYGAPRVALIQGPDKRILTWDRTPWLERLDVKADPGERSPLDGGPADDEARTRFAADWSLFARLATAGTATLAVTASPTLDCPPMLTVESPLSIVPVTGAGLDSPPLATCTGVALQIPLEGSARAPILLQLDGLTESTPPLRMRITCDNRTLTEASLHLPSGTTFDGDWALIPTPWSNPPSPAITPPPTNTELTLTWLRPTTDLPSISAPEDPLQDRLKELGYVE